VYKICDFLDTLFLNEKIQKKLRNLVKSFPVLIYNLINGVYNLSLMGKKYK